MTKEQALKALKKIFGDAAWWRVGDSISGPERRAVAKEEAENIKTQIVTIDTEIKRREIEAGIVELQKTRSKLRRDREIASSYAHYYKFSVGKRSSIFIEQTSDGDTWQEAVDKAAAKKGV